MPKSNKTTEKKPGKTMNKPQDVGRGKNAGGQTNGQFERDMKHGRGQFVRAGDSPRIVK